MPSGRIIGGSLNLNVHFHQIFIDGCYEISSTGEPVNFIATQPPTLKDLEQILAKIIKRLVKYLEKQKIIVQDQENPFQLEISEEDSFSRLQASSITYRFATGPSKGKKALSLKTVPETDHNSNYGLVAKSSGFSLHAGVATRAHERDRLERICRYIARPAVTEGRLSLNAKGEVIYKFKKPWDDGTTAIKLTQMEIMEKLTALVPRPRVHLTRFHGVLGPHYKYRKLIVPKQIETLVIATDGVAIDSNEYSDPKRISWARLLKRVFNIDITHCPKCNGKIKIISAIEDPSVIKQILNHLGLPATQPTLQNARGPPESDEYFTQQFYDE